MRMAPIRGKTTSNAARSHCVRVCILVCVFVCVFVFEEVRRRREGGGRLDVLKGVG